MGTQTLLTVDSFVQSAKFLDERTRLELRNGEVVDMGETNAWHNYARDEILTALRNFLRQTGRGQALAETGFRVTSNSWYRADVVFWDAAHWAMIDIDHSPIEIVPQLVVEVVSPSETNAFEKADDYLRAGVDTVWVVLRRPYEIHVFEASDARRIVRAGDKLDAPRLLPGFSEEAARFRLV